MTVIRTVEIAEPQRLFDHRPTSAWVSERQVLIGHGEAFRVSAGLDPTRFERAETHFRDWVSTCDIVDELDLPGTGPCAFGSFTFDERSTGSMLIVPEIIMGRHKDTWFLTTVDDVDPEPFLAGPESSSIAPDRPRFAGASIPDVSWVEAVAEVIERIRAGEAEKVVLARDFALWSRTQFDIKRMLERLIERFPSCFTFLVDGLVGASPELLVRSDGSSVESVVLAGTIGRSHEPSEDDRLAKLLLSSKKDLFEHHLAASSVERVLAEQLSGLERDDEPQLRRFDNVQHLATSFKGQLKDQQSALQLAARLHPTAAVGGEPTDVAVDLIRQLEGMDRGRYAGPVGWVDASGSGEFAIALRCAEISGARARLFAGAGIMADSYPERELEETRLKLDTMLRALE